MSAPDPEGMQELADRSMRSTRYALAVIPLSCIVIYLGMGTKEPGKTVLIVLFSALTIVQTVMSIRASITGVKARHRGWTESGNVLAGVLLAGGALVAWLMGIFMMAFGHSGRGY